MHESRHIFCARVLPTYVALRTAIDDRHYGGDAIDGSPAQNAPNTLSDEVSPLETDVI